MDYNFGGLAPVVRENEAEAVGDGSKASWTAARCDSLLTTLVSRVELLKEDARKFLAHLAPSEPSLSQNDLEALRVKRKTRTTYGKRGRKENDQGSTFRRRQRSDGPSSFVPSGRGPGEAAGATPLLKRSRGLNTTLKPSSASNATLEVEGRCSQPGSIPRPVASPWAPSQLKVRQALNQIKLRMREEQYTASLDICNSFQALLRATEEIPDARSGSSKSLLSTCLRAMPDRMKLEQEWENQRANSITDGCDMTHELYSEIEEMDLSGEGWRHLRTVLRAHGTAIVSNAIKDGILCHQFGMVLVMNCIRSRDSQEAEALSMAMLSNIELDPPASLYCHPSDALAVVGLGSGSATHSWNSAAFFRMVTDLLISGRLPVHWLVTKGFQSLWPKLFLSMAAEVPCKDAEDFCATALTLLAQAANTTNDLISTSVTEAVAKTFVSLLSALCSVVLLNQRPSSSQLQPSGPQVASVTRVFRPLMVELCVIGSAGVISRYSCTAALANLIIIPVDDIGKPHIRRLLDMFTSADNELYNSATSSLSDLICAIGDRCERAEAGQGATQLRILGDLITALTSSSQASLLCLQVALVDGISAFSRHQADGAASEAKEMGRIFCARFNLPQAQAPRSGRGFEDEDRSPNPSLNLGEPSGCRWEEGIEEWVAMTPAVVSIQDGSSFSSLHVEGPVSPLASYRGRVRPHPPGAHKRKRPSRKPSAQPTFLDLVPSSPDPINGSDTDFESSFLSEITCYSQEPPSPVNYSTLASPPRKVRNFDMAIRGPLLSGNSHSRSLPAEEHNSRKGEATSQSSMNNPCATIKIPGSIRYRTPLPPLFRGADEGILLDGSLRDMESSGDELGY